ncbi:phytase [Deinococcus aquaedulcis]|uniref:phytase n=1 Tax=Deinococcus aquaedulcis TaxID=2840455 RepID=UPI002E2DA455|nr:phytase [Deinococcus aquaedulcis]
MNTILLSAALAGVALTLAACAQAPAAQEVPPALSAQGRAPAGPVNVPARFETAGVTDPADSDDPAIWIHPRDPRQSMVIGTRKEAGLTVFDLQGRTLQDLAPASVRYNNVDVVYGFMLAGKRVDLAVASDRKNDRLAVYAINPLTRQLSDVTSARMPLVFTPAGQVSDGANTAYGLATYRTKSGRHRVFVSQRQNPRVAEWELMADAGRVSARPVRTITLPAGTVEDPQVEGMVVDAEHGVVYLGQEQVGIWAAPLSGRGTPRLIERVRPAGSRLSADVEGLTLYDAGDGEGYLLASSQGDNTFAVFDREDHDYLGAFRVIGGAIDGAEESDGAMVANVNFGPLFPKGLLVVQDGFNDGVEDHTNFKLVAWQDVARPLDLEDEPEDD